jgi:hypothetical protein
VSFFDEGDEPRRAARPRRAAATAPRAADQRTLLVRRGVAAGALLLVAILLVVGIRGCLNSQKQSGLKEYNQHVGELVKESDEQVGKPFFQLLSSGRPGDPVDLQAQVNQLRVTADSQVDRARRLDVPGEMQQAQLALLYTLEFRRDGLEKIAEKLPTALARSPQATQAINQIAGQMQLFLASDVMYSQRVIPNIQKALDDANVGGQTITPSRFLPNLGWLDPTVVAQRLGSAGGTRRTGPVAPGTHGHELISTTLGGVDLNPDEENRVPAGSNLAFTVTFQNQGENDESQVEVKITIEGAGRPIQLSKVVPKTAAGETVTTEIPVTQAPPIGTPVTVNVEIVGVPGEETTDNNKRSYPVVFER